MKAEKYKHTKEENKNLTFVSNYIIKMFTVPCNNYVAYIWSWWHFSNWVKVLPIFLMGQNLALFRHFSFRHVRLPCHLTLFYSGWGSGNFRGNFQFYFLSAGMTIIVDSQLPEERILSWSSICFLSVNFAFQTPEHKVGIKPQQLFCGAEKVPHRGPVGLCSSIVTGSFFLFPSSLLCFL